MFTRNNMVTASNTFKTFCLALRFFAFLAFSSSLWLAVACSTDESIVSSFSISFAIISPGSSKNIFIHKLCDKFDEVGIEYKKESFYLLRNTFLEILENKDINNFMNSLSNTNRKKFEQIIISESLEEYDLLKKLSEDTKSINYMKRYGKILKSEEEKIKNFNDSLIASNSWKLTKIFRLIRIKWF